jgi:hypothetical protein
MLKKVLIILVGLIILGLAALTFVKMPAPKKEILKEIPVGQGPLSSK